MNHAMLRLAARLWNDDAGAIIAAEYLFVATILVIGVVVGLTSVREAINSELTELANALLALSQGYVISGTSGATGSTDGSQAIDTPSLIVDPTLTPPAIPSVIDVVPCN
jgi:Flp pilus assembly pilin Flp